MSGKNMYRKFKHTCTELQTAIRSIFLSSKVTPQSIKWKSCFHLFYFLNRIIQFIGKLSFKIGVSSICMGYSENSMPVTVIYSGNLKINNLWKYELIKLTVRKSFRKPRTFVGWEGILVLGKKCYNYQIQMVSNNNRDRQFSQPTKLSWRFINKWRMWTVDYKSSARHVKICIRTMHVW